MVRALPSVVPDFEPAPPPRLTGAGPVSWRPPNVPRFPEAGRVVSAPESAAVDLGVRVDELPEWWVTRIADAQRPQAQVRSVGLSDLIDQAIAQSPRIRLLQRLPAIAETQIDRDQSAFDPTWRMDTQYRDDQEPVGNQLITGGPPVLQENTWTGSVGLQRRFLSGAVADVYQRLGFQNSNSIFFEPQDQGTATLGLDVTQPLAFGRGREFNQAAIVLAELQAQLSFFDYQAELQQEMVEIGSLYWQLLHARMLVLQIERSRQRAQQILDILQARASYDTTAHQISLAKAEVSQRTTEWLESTQSVREFEISLRDRIADQDFAEDHDVELLPAEFADEVFVDTDLPLHAALHRAMSGRWELQRQQGRTQIADRQLYLSRCGLAPRLDLVLGVYANGLAGESGINRAWVNQFDTGRPGYYGGFEFELPQGRRNAKAAVQRDQLQKQQAMDAYQVARNEVISQVKTAHSRVDTARQSRQAAYAAVIDMRAALIHLQKRWENTALIDGSAIDGVSPALALEQLLAGQRRLQDAEASLAWADLQAALARQGLLLAMGEVLKTDLPQVLPADDMTP
jgi:outer membrane protein TolC